MLNNKSIGLNIQIIVSDQRLIGSAARQPANVPTSPHGTTCGQVVERPLAAAFGADVSRDAPEIVEELFYWYVVICLFGLFVFSCAYRGRIEVAGRQSGGLGGPGRPRQSAWPPGSQ